MEHWFPKISTVPNGTSELFGYPSFPKTVLTMWGSMLSMLQNFLRPVDVANSLFKHGMQFLRLYKALCHLNVRPGCGQNRLVWPNVESASCHDLFRASRPRWLMKPKYHVAFLVRVIPLIIALLISDTVIEVMAHLCHDLRRYSTLDQLGIHLKRL